MSKPIVLDQDEFEFLLKYVACRTFLDEYDQHLEITMMGMQRRVPGFGIKDQQELHDDMLKYQSVIAENPRLQEALSSREWYLAKQNGLYTLAYKKNVFEKLEDGGLYFIDLLESTLEGLITLSEYKEFRWGMGGFLSGGLMVMGYFQPIWVIKILVFVFVAGLVGFLGLVGAINLSEHFRALPDSKEPLTTREKFVFTCMLLLVFGIAIFVGAFMASAVKENTSPYEGDLEQIYR